MVVFFSSSGSITNQLRMGMIPMKWKKYQWWVISTRREQLTLLNCETYPGMESQETDITASRATKYQTCNGPGPICLTINQTASYPASTAGDQKRDYSNPHGAWSLIDRIKIRKQEARLVMVTPLSHINHISWLPLLLQVFGKSSLQILYPPTRNSEWIECQPRSHGPSQGILLFVRNIFSGYWPAVEKQTNSSYNS